MKLKALIEELRSNLKKCSAYGVCAIQIKRNGDGEEVTELAITEVDTEEESKEVNLHNAGATKKNGLKLEELLSKLEALMPARQEYALFSCAPKKRTGDFTVRIDTPIVGTGWDHDGRKFALVESENKDAGSV